MGEGRLGGERGLDEDDEARRRECKRAATILSLSLSLSSPSPRAPPAQCTAIHYARDARSVQGGITCVHA